MEKKKMTNKKKFWIGMSSLAAVGVITATVAYFSSTHEFLPDTLKTKNYNVTTEKLLDTAEAQKMTPNKALNAEVKVTNNGDIPILARITYYWTGDIAMLDSDGEIRTGTTENTAINLGSNSLKGLGWNFDVTNNFECGKDSDGNDVYYYKGVIAGEGVAQHLKSITYKGQGGVKTDDYSTTTDGTNWSKTIAEGASLKGEKYEYTLSNNATLKVKVETIQATDEDGNVLNENSLKEEGEDVVTVNAVKRAWDTAMGIK